MTHKQLQLIEKIELYVRELFEKRKNDKLLFHNLRHTLDVVNHSSIIGQKSSLNPDEMFILIAAAWFHDTGYNYTINEHEEKSKKIAESFLSQLQVPENDILAIKQCIDATKHPQSPKNKISEVLCDADLYHVSQQYFIDITLQFRKERNTLHNEKIKKIDYFEETIGFLNAKTFFTEYGKKALEQGKQKNIQLLKEKIRQIKDKKAEKEIQTQKKSSKKNVEKIEKAEKVQSPSRGIETMFRMTARNQINLSSIADNKANILISVTSIIISLVVSFLARKFDDLPQIIIPTLIFLLTCLITLVISILSTRPNISSGKFTRDDIREKKVNLLFFGNFYDMGLEDYDWAIKEMMDDYGYLYSTMIKDQFYLGKVLSKKYKLLRHAYTIFMFGFVLSVISFVISILIVQVNS